MFNPLQYSVILKARPGEMEGLAHLRQNIRQEILPIIDVPSTDLDTDSPNASKTIEAHLIQKADLIKMSWPSALPLFVDFLDVPSSTRTLDGSHPLTFFFGLLRGCFARCIPATNLFRDNDYNEAVAKEINKTGAGLLIRVFEDDMFPTSTLNEKLHKLLTGLKISPKDAHILLDFRSIFRVNPNFSCI
jgi:hypothetical protein